MFFDMSNRFFVGLSTFPSCVKKTNITLATKKRDWEYFVVVVVVVATKVVMEFQR